MPKKRNDSAGKMRKPRTRAVGATRRPVSGQPKITTIISGEANVDRLLVVGNVHGNIEVAVPPARMVGPPLSRISAASVPDRSGMYGYDVDFVGRQQELAELHRFLDGKTEGPGDFAWWIWSAPGGQGKSRLASHLYLQAENDGWDCGFLSSIEDFNAWNEWLVSKPTLVIIDQVASRAEQIQKAICSIARRPDNIRAPLRFLLLERPFGLNDAWVKEFVPPRSAERDRSDFFSGAYHGDGRRSFDELLDCTRLLGPTTPDESWDIFASVLDKKGAPHPDREAALDLLGRIDEARRPLFVVLAAEATATSGFDQLRRWNRDDLVRFVLNREFDIWLTTLRVDRSEPTSARSLRFEGHVNEVVYSTIAGPQRSQDLKDVENLGVPLPDRLQSDWLRVLTGAAHASEVLVAPLTPDLVGELFVLERALGHFAVDSNMELPRAHTRRLLDIAMAHSSHRAIDFAKRCIQDFPDHPALAIFSEIAIPEADIHYAFFDDYCVHMSEVSRAFEKLERWDLAEAIFSRMLTYACRFTQPAEVLLERRVSALYNRALVRGRQLKAEEAEEDCNTALDLIEGAIGSMRTIYRYHLIDLRRRTLLVRASVIGRTRGLEAAAEDIDRILSDPDADATIKAEAVIARAGLRSGAHDRVAALEDYEAILESPEPGIGEQKKAAVTELRPLLWELAREARSANAYGKALHFYGRLLALPDGSPQLEAWVRVNRSEIHLRMGDLESCILDCSEVLRADGAPEEQKQKAQINRAQALLLQGQEKKALRDINKLLRSVRPPGRLWTSAMVLLAKVRRMQGDDARMRKALRAIEACQDADEDLRTVARQTLAVLSRRIEGPSAS